MEQELRNKVKSAAKEYFDKILNNKKDMEYIPPSGKVLGFEELENMIDASLDMWLTTGRFNNEFEKEFAKYLGTEFALTTNSGSSANLLAISALTSWKLGERALRAGDEVITVATSFPTTINPIIQLGLIPVFVDCEIGTYNIDAEKIEGAISEKTKAIFVAHTLGNSFDLGKVMCIAKKYNLWVIEDTCDALGAEYENKKLGTVGDIGTFSFYPAHHITMGEGGAVVTNNQELHKIIRSFRDWGRDCACPTGFDGICNKRFSVQHGKLPFGYDHKYVYSHLGYNLKITDWQASIGLAQLKKIDKFVKKRTENAQFMTEKLSDLKDFLILPEISANCKPSWFGYLISVKENCGFSKQKLVEHLEKNKIGTRQLFSGNILRQPMFIENDINFRINNSPILNSKNLGEKIYKMLPNTEFIMNNTFWVGVYPAISDVEIEKISNCIHDFFNK